MHYWVILKDLIMSELSRTYANLTGQLFGTVKVLSFAGRSRHKHIQWNCRCACGHTFITTTYKLRGSGSRKPQQFCTKCSRQVLLKRLTIHGGTGTTEYNIYRLAKRRCENDRDPYYPRYGGRGIEFRFTSFRQFLEELGPRPSLKFSLNRINNDGHYEPGNVEWATATEQARNRSTNRLISANGKHLLAAQWSELTGIKITTIVQRLAHGWCDECSVTLPTSRGGYRAYQTHCTHR